MSRSSGLRIRRGGFWPAVYVGAIALVLVLALFGSTASVVRADTATVKGKVTFQQTTARSMLKMVNDFRTGDDAWAWNSTNSEKIYYSNLSALTYDYNLEQIAMQRAVEIVLCWGHTRPDGTSCFTTTYNSTRSSAENLAINFSNVEVAFDQWLEEDADYSGQGHRRNMLGKSYNAIGIAHVVVDGCHFYVQEFGLKNSGATATSPEDKTGTRAINVDTASLTMSMSLNKTSVSVEYGKSLARPTQTISLRSGMTWSGSPSLPLDPSSVSSSWSSANSSVAKVSGSKVVGQGIGSTKITVKSTIGNCTASSSFTVKVTTANLSSATVDPVAARTFTGSAIKPTVNVKCGDRVLVSGTDYSLTYSNNTNIGTATITIKGKGNYTGTTKTTFTIKAPSVGKVINPKAVSASFKSVKVSWDAVNGATGYQVWRSTSGSGDFVCLGSVTATSRESVALTTGTTYYYKVRAYKEVAGTKFYGSYSAVVSAAPKPSLPTKITLQAQSPSSVKISWTATSDVKFVQVWQATKANAAQSDYTLVGEYSGTAKNCLANHLTPNKTYYYKLRSYVLSDKKVKVFSAFTSVYSVKPTVSVGIPTALRVTATTKDSITLEWNAVAGTNINYEVYRLTSPTATPGAMIKRTALTTKTSYSLESGKTYYYRVRAYYFYTDQDGNTKRVYGAYTSIISGTTK